MHVLNYEFLIRFLSSPEGLKQKPFPMKTWRRRKFSINFNSSFFFPALVDTLLLLYYVLDYGAVGTFVRSQEPHVPEPYWYRITFPYLLHPFKFFSISGSIFMVVAISAERHRAICSPLTHRPAFWPYAVMVVCVAGEFTCYWIHFNFCLKSMFFLVEHLHLVILHMISMLLALGKVDKLDQCSGQRTHQALNK
jgi:hypothetical protein